MAPTPTPIAAITTTLPSASSVDKGEEEGGGEATTTGATTGATIEATDTVTLAWVKRAVISAIDLKKGSDDSVEPCHDDDDGDGKNDDDDDDDGEHAMLWCIIRYSI